ncbi:hypothetical protein [Ligilactobacillus cholophilus]|uniref:hypothetical protein n=1 Tax=Ligilactobacillus cholophilus TaxID=3050131 RepID=UPI0025AF3E07|nr:hypothetical protein [Ligilactobacillus cholophilus]
MNKEYSLIISNDDIEFLKSDFSGIYSLLSPRLSSYSKNSQVAYFENENDFQELWNRFSFEISNAVDQNGELSSSGKRLQKIWNEKNLENNGKM